MPIETPLILSGFQDLYINSSDCLPYITFLVELRESGVKLIQLIILRLKFFFHLINILLDKVLLM